MACGDLEYIIGHMFRYTHSELVPSSMITVITNDPFKS
jgi:hypothetical protein